MNPQEQWQAAVLSYAESVNRYVDEGQRNGWEGLADPQMPKTEHLLDAWKEALVAINQSATTDAERDAFREAWPPAVFPLTPLLDDEGRGIPTLALLDDGSVLARIGTPYQGGYVVHIRGVQAERVVGVDFFGRCPQRRYFAVANDDGVRVIDGWGGPVVARLNWPTGLEGVPAGLAVEPLEHRPSPTQLIPFPDGQRVLLVSSEGIFVLAEEGARRLLPRTESIQEQLDDGTDPDDIGMGLSMEHAAISPDGQWIAVGEQCSSHIILNAQFEQVADIGPAGEYPHFAMFNHRGDRVILNACHFYNGGTVGVAVKDFPGLQTDFYSDDPRTPVVQKGARVYAGASRGDEFIIGDAYGYLRAFGENGEERWQHYIGSTIGAIDVSADGKTLVASTYAGVITTVALDTQRPAWQVGTGEHQELRRWLFWNSLDTPLIW